MKHLDIRFQVLIQSLYFRYRPVVDDIWRSAGSQAHQGRQSRPDLLVAILGHNSRLSGCFPYILSIELVLFHSTQNMTKLASTERGELLSQKKMSRSAYQFAAMMPIDDV